MKNVRLVVLFFVLFAGFAAAQNGAVLYFCERYGSNGEVGISDRFTTGYITVMVKSDYALNLDECYIQFDKWDGYTGKFNYYKKFEYNVDPDMSYIYFSKNADSDMSFDDPGFYRVFLLDDRSRTVASALIQIVSK